MPTERVAVAVSRSYHRAVTRLGNSTAAAFAGTWMRLGSYDERDMARWVRTVTPLLDASRTAATSYAAAYLARMLDQPPIAVDLDHLPDGAVDLRRPFLRTWHLLDGGERWSDAVRSGAGEARAVGSEAAFRSARAATEQLSKSTGKQIVGYRRMTGPTACRWCATAATQRYRTVEAARLGDKHVRCNCTPVPILGTVDPGRVINGPLLDALDAHPDAPYVTSAGEPAGRPD